MQSLNSNQLERVKELIKEYKNKNNVGFEFLEKYEEITNRKIVEILEYRKEKKYNYEEFEIDFILQNVFFNYKLGEEVTCPMHFDAFYLIWKTFYNKKGYSIPYEDMSFDLQSLIILIDIDFFKMVCKDNPKTIIAIADLLTDEHLKIVNDNLFESDINKLYEKIFSIGNKLKIYQVEYLNHNPLKLREYLNVNPNIPKFIKLYLLINKPDINILNIPFIKDIIKNDKEEYSGMFGRFIVNNNTPLIKYYIEIFKPKRIYLDTYLNIKERTEKEGITICCSKEDGLEFNLDILHFMKFHKNDEMFEILKPFCDYELFKKTELVTNFCLLGVQKYYGMIGEISFKLTKTSIKVNIFTNSVNNLQKFNIKKDIYLIFHIVRKGIVTLTGLILNFEIPLETKNVYIIDDTMYKNEGRDLLSHEDDKIINDKLIHFDSKIYIIRDNDEKITFEKLLESGYQIMKEFDNDNILLNLPKKRHFHFDLYNKSTMKLSLVIKANIPFNAMIDYFNNEKYYCQIMWKNIDENDPIEYVKELYSKKNIICDNEFKLLDVF